METSGVVLDAPHPHRPAARADRSRGHGPKPAEREVSPDSRRQEHSRRGALASGAPAPRHVRRGSVRRRNAPSRAGSSPNGDDHHLQGRYLVLAARDGAPEMLPHATRASRQALPPTRHSRVNQRVPHRLLERGMISDRQEMWGSGSKPSRPTISSANPRPALPSRHDNVVPRTAVIAIQLPDTTHDRLQGLVRTRSVHPGKMMVEFAARA